MLRPVTPPLLICGSRTFWYAGFVSLVSILGSLSILSGEDASRTAAPAGRAAQLATEKPAALAPDLLAVRIDAALVATWKRNGVEPAPLTTDSEFIRRAALDLVGRVPSVAEVRAFLEDPRPEKRRRLVEEFLQQGACAAHFANCWRDLLLTGTGAADARPAARGLENWLRLRFSANLPYDQVVSELLTADGRMGIPSTAEPSVAAFYQAAEFKPEQIASSVARVFLGVQVQCAQCHDHPFAQWKQPQFWSFAAFFANADGTGAGELALTADSLATGAEIRIPEKNVAVPARFLDGSAPAWKAGDNRRAVLARWITSPENPYFARAIVNRVWEHFCGRGFVDPVDDLDPAHAPQCPEIFDELTQQFVLQRYDLHYLVQVITATRAYQVSSRSAGQPSDERQIAVFARIPLRRMTSDQLYASFVQATGYREPQGNAQVPADNSVRAEFQQKFGDTSRPRTEAETTILQALSLMNGKLVSKATDLQASEVLAAVAESPFLNTAARIETLFLATLSRPPEAAELAGMVEYCHRSKGDSKAALADVFWALLNSAEFILNH